MSLQRSKELILVAKLRARELRKSQTPSEEVLWQHLRDRKFHGIKFYRQYQIFADEDGRETFYIADFYCHTHKLVIELDGRIHDRQQAHDNLRTAVINQKGLTVLRFGNDEVENSVNKVLAKIKEYLDNYEL